MSARIITALPLAGCCIVLILWLPTDLFALVLLAFLLPGLYEWSRLCRQSIRVYWVLAAILAAAAVLLSVLPAVCLLLFAALGGVFWLGQAIGLIGCKIQHSRSGLGGLLQGLLILLICWCALVWLHALPPDGPMKVVGVLLIVWSADSFAYFVGRAFGRRKLAPSISPGKTLEGALGGMVGVVVVGALMAFFPLRLVKVELFFWVAAALVAAFAGIIGDLFESRLKRTAGVKDSGCLLPGHGGMLDRIDSMLAAAPVFVTLWWALA